MKTGLSPESVSSTREPVYFLRLRAPLDCSLIRSAALRSSLLLYGSRAVSSAVPALSYQLSSIMKSNESSCEPRRHSVSTGLTPSSTRPPGATFRCLTKHYGWQPSFGHTLDKRGAQLPNQRRSTSTS